MVLIQIPIIDDGRLCQRSNPNDVQRRVIQRLVLSVIGLQPWAEHHAAVRDAVSESLSYVIDNSAGTVSQGLVSNEAVPVGDFIGRNDHGKAGSLEFVQNAQVLEVSD